VDPEDSCEEDGLAGADYSSNQIQADGDDNNDDEVEDDECDALS